MKPRIVSFVLGCVISSLVWIAAGYVPTVVALRRSSVPMWDRETVRKNGYDDLRESGTVLLNRWDVGRVAALCQRDFATMAIGKVELGPIYEYRERGALILFFAADTDQWGKYVTDRVIAYVYDEQTRILIGKFWVPMA